MAKFVNTLTIILEKKEYRAIKKQKLQCSTHI